MLQFAMKKEMGICYCYHCCIKVGYELGRKKTKNIIILFMTPEKIIQCLVCDLAQE